GAALGFGEDESALENRLCVQGEVFGLPIGVKPVSFHGFCDVGLDLGGVAADGAVDGVADRRMRLVSLLDQGACEAGEFADLAFQNGFAKVDVAENPIEWVGVGVIGGGVEESAGRLRPMVSRRDCEVLLAREVMEERSLGYSGGGAE